MVSPRVGPAVAVAVIAALALGGTGCWHITTHLIGAAPIDLTVRVSGGMIETSERDRGAQVLVTVGGNAHLAGHHYLTPTIRAGVQTERTDPEPVIGFGADWVWAPSALVTRLGVAYATPKLATNPRYHAAELRGALAVAVFRGGAAGDSAGEITADPPGPGDRQGRLSLGVEAAGRVIADGDTSDGRTALYGGLVLEYDVLTLP